MIFSLLQKWSQFVTTSFIFGVDIAKNHAILMSMIITTNQTNTIKSADFKTSACSIDAEDMKYISSLLRNNYSDPMLATMREIIANGIDASCGTKVDVQLPTRIEPNFIVRDYGEGLSEEDMLGLYSKFGKSTKRDANKSIGGFGVGKFAPLAYTDSFIIVSYHDGVKDSYTMKVDDDEGTSIQKLFSEDSEEANGIYIQVPVENQHIEPFNLKFKNFSRYLQGSLNVKNDSFDYIEPEISCDVFDFFVDPSEYYYRASKQEECNNAYILMGGIMYPVKREDNHKNFVKGLVYKAKIGEFKLHHSREALEYNNSTVEKLKEASDKIALELKKQLKSKFNSCHCLYEATKIQYNTVAKYGRFFSKAAVSVDFDPTKFGDQVVSSSLFDKKGVKLTKVSRNRNGNLSFSNPQWIGASELDPDENHIFVIDDGVLPRAPSSRLSFLDRTQRVTLIIGKSEETQKTLLNRFKMMKSPMVKLLSECERIITKRVATKKSLGSSLTGTDILLFDKDARCYKQSDVWEAQKEDLPDSETYYYVRYHANKFQKLDGGAFGRDGDSPLANKNFVSSLMGINPDFKNVYGVRRPSLKKAAKMSNWIPLESVYVDWIKNSTKVQDTVNNIAIDEALYERFGHHHPDLCSFTNQLCKKTASNQIIKNLKNVFKTRDCLLNNKITREQRILLSLELVKPTIVKEKKAINDFDKKYPLIKNLVRGSVFDPSQDLSDVVDYIKNW